MSRSLVRFFIYSVTTIGLLFTFTVKSDIHVFPVLEMFKVYCPRTIRAIMSFLTGYQKFNQIVFFRPHLIMDLTSHPHATFRIGITYIYNLYHQSTPSKTHCALQPRQLC